MEMSNSKTILAMNINYSQSQDGYYEGSFTITSDSEQWIELMNDVRGNDSELKKYENITLKTPDACYYLKDVSLMGYSDSLNMSKDYATTSFRFICNRIVGK